MELVGVTRKVKVAGWERRKQTAVQDIDSSPGNKIRIMFPSSEQEAAG